MLRPNNVWYCKVLLLFSIQAQTDQNSSTEEFQCAFVSVLEPLAEQSPYHFKELRKRSSLLDLKVPLVYVVPIQSILGKLLLFPVGDTETNGGPFLSSLLHAHGLSMSLLLKNSTWGLTVTLQMGLAMAAVSGTLTHLH